MREGARFRRTDRGFRRSLLRGLLWTGSIILPVLQCEAAEITLTILHTNDLQGRFGQMLKVGMLAKQIQRKVGRVLLLDAGNALAPSEDAFVHPQRGGALTVDLFNRAGYDAWNLGRRDLDRSRDRLSGTLRGTTFPVLGANLHRAETGRYLFQVQPYAVVRFSDLRVGILGLSSGGGGVMVADPVAAARYYVPMLRQLSDLVVLLTHQRFEADSTLAASVPGIDLIVGGGYSERAPAPPPEVNGVLIRQAGEGGAFLGRIDLKVTEGKVTDGKGQPIALDGTVKGGADSEAVFGGWSAEVDGEKVELMAVLGTSAGGFGTSVGKGAAMGYLVADLVRTSAASDVAFIAASSVDPELPEGPIRVLDLYGIYAWPYRLATVSLPGRQVWAILEKGLSNPQAFFYPSGLEMIYDLSRPEGDRVVSVTVGDRPLDLEKGYRVAVEDGVAETGGAGLFGIATLEKSGVPIRDLLARHIKTAGVVRGEVDGRMQGR